MATLFKMTSVSKLLQQINDLNDKKQIVESLKVNGHPVLKSILKYMFDPSIKFLLPEGKPPFRSNPHDEPKALLMQANKLYLFVEGGNPRLNPIKREHLFIQILETVNTDDAELLIAMKDKKSPYKNITKAVVKEAFPELITQNEQVK
jgi:Family of unknown function (DUF6433)